VIVSGILQAADIAGYCREVRAELLARQPAVPADAAD
jgi:hypothetical protein